MNQDKKQSRELSKLFILKTHSSLVYLLDEKLLPVLTFWLRLTDNHWIPALSNTVYNTGNADRFIYLKNTVQKNNQDTHCEFIGVNEKRFGISMSYLVLKRVCTYIKDVYIRLLQLRRPIKQELLVDLKVATLGLYCWPKFV